MPTWVIMANQTLVQLLKLVHEQVHIIEPIYMRCADLNLLIR